MNPRATLASLLPLCLLLSHCGGDTGDTGPGGGAGNAKAASIATQLSAAAVTPTEARFEKFRGGAASAAGLESLKYQITSITICESLETNGSGYNNPRNCLELYRYDNVAFHYGLNDDWTPLANLARTTDEGFVDLLSAASRSQLARSTELTHEHVRSYNYGLINWALPIKVKATVQLGDGSFLYTHDGVSRFETVGSDNFRAYFTDATTSLAQPPAETAVVLLPNGGNWFKFQSPFTITDADIDERRAFVLDLVFNPDGIVQGFAESFTLGNIRERGAADTARRDITVPMLDLAPVPHRATEQVMRESYRSTLTLDGSEFDLRLELYYVEGDATDTVYGVDVKTLVNARTRQIPPSGAKISFLERAADGTLTFSSFSHTPVITGMRRVTGASGTTSVKLACATHRDRAGAQGGAALVAETCPSPLLDVSLTLVSRTRVDGSIPTAVGAGPAVDAGADSGAPLTLLIGGLDGGVR